MKAKTKTVIIAALAILDCTLGGFIITNAFSRKDQTKNVDIKASANYIDQTVSKAGNDIMVSLEAEKMSKELEVASKVIPTEIKKEAAAKAQANKKTSNKVVTSNKTTTPKKATTVTTTKNGKYTYVASAKTSVATSEVYKKVQAQNPWKGVKLTRQNGAIQGPSGKETYYNLNMSGVVSIMRKMGNKDPYWVRSDGVKMLGNYVMVAADFRIRPRGSIVPTSLGLGIVVDTGTFIYSNPKQLDIAVSW